MTSRTMITVYAKPAAAMTDQLQTDFTQLFPKKIKKNQKKHKETQKNKLKNNQNEQKFPKKHKK